MKIWTCRGKDDDDDEEAIPTINNVVNFHSSRDEGELESQRKKKTSMKNIPSENDEENQKTINSSSSSTFVR